MRATSQQRPDLVTAPQGRRWRSSACTGELGVVQDRAAMRNAERTPLQDHRRPLWRRRLCVWPGDWRASRCGCQLLPDTWPGRKA
eukprot:5961236-Pleurochrysis_carterae.AAC.2